MTENVLQSDGQADLQVDTRLLQATKNKRKQKTEYNKRASFVHLRSLWLPIRARLNKIQVTAFQEGSKLLVKTLNISSASLPSTLSIKKQRERMGMSVNCF